MTDMVYDKGLRSRMRSIVEEAVRLSCASMNMEQMLDMADHMLGLLDEELEVYRP